MAFVVSSFYKLYDSVPRTFTRRRRKSQKNTSDDMIAPNLQDENIRPIIDKCLICRHSECVGNKCCEALHPVKHHHNKMQSKKDQLSPSSSSQGSSQTVQIVHNQQQRQHSHHYHRHLYHNNKQKQQHQLQQHQERQYQLQDKQKQPQPQQKQQQQQQQQRYCYSSTGCKLDIKSSTSTSSQSNSDKEKLLRKNHIKLSDTRWVMMMLSSLSIHLKCEFLSLNYLKKFKLWRTFMRKIPLFFTWFAISLLLVNFSVNLIISGAYANEIKPRLRSTGKVCPSMDIRNSPAEFKNLSECSVIEGFLIISLMDKYSAQDYELSFPLLTEITDYMMIYRVNGLKTLGKLFPNLSVIRGNILFEGYALVIYENIHLEEIALVSLTTIKRGAVRIEKNPLLCFVATVNWEQIAINTARDNHFFWGNKVLNECPSCPGGNTKSDRTDGGNQQDDLPSCPEITGSRYCWNRQHCQKICPSHCKSSCNDRGECCNESCLGGCANSDVNLCSVCRHLVWGNECTDTCPNGSFRYLERSCVSPVECFNKLPPLNQDMRHEYPYVPFDGICSTRCPPGHEKVDNRTCRQCDDKCVKKCPSMSIDSISDARRLRGCTLISGSLIISIRQGGPHVMEDLESALSTIEEIEGYLKVTRSFSLLSLSFLKGLRIIRGTELDSSKYALYVLDNQNLQNIWGDNQTVRIERGRIFFHFNPKLCYYKIENLRTMMVDNKTLDKSEVATDSNGDRGSCNITTLNVTVAKIGSKAVVVKVQPMEFEDDRGFIGYQYYYIEAPHKNISIYDSRQGCGNDGWNLDDDNTKETDHIFTHLKPYTQYAFYVKTYTISTETNNGQSPIIYFRTLPDKPEPVRNLRSVTNSSSEVIVKWSPPRVANGNLTTYVIKANLTLDDPKLLDQRNYCNEPISKYSEHPFIQANGKDTIRTDKDGKECMCDDQDTRGSKPVTRIEENVVVDVINFEDAIQNFIYVKREDYETKSVRRKRDLENLTNTDTSTDSGDHRIFPNDRPIISDEIDPKEVTVSKKKANYYTYIYAMVNTSTQELVLKDLKHYSTYTISVKACREGTGDRCSNEAITYSRTSKLAGADTIENLIVEVESTNTSRSNVRLKWEPPKNPNSLIVSYSIKYARADIEHARGVDKCITQREYQNLTGGYVLTGLETGNYSVQILATSLAGDGNYTIPLYFYIPETRMSWQVVVSIVIPLLILVILTAVLFWYIRKKYLAPVPDLKLFTSVNPEYVSMHYTPDEWEIPREKIIQLRELGQGSFGMVYEGIVKNLNKSEEDTPCAIKTVNESATDRERINFLNEASVMKEFDTHHVVRLLGVCSRGQPTLVVMELMKNGDLKAYLRSHRPDAELMKAGEPPPQPPTLKRILQMAIEIADGMAYLSAKKFVHRDLAARNCMVAADLTVKIGDFGMTRDIYETDYYRKGTKGLLPVRWMAPESLKDGVFTSASDVFSYGVVLWEMATLASQPYQGLSNDQVLRYVIDGGVMERPENCPDKLYNLMRKCWQHRPNSRPTFIEIIQILLDDADAKFKDVSFYHSPEGQDLLAQMQPATDLDDVTTPLRVGDDDFKMEIEDNYLTNSKHSRRSHLAATEGQPHSPYSFGSATLTSSTPRVVSFLKRSNPSNLSSSLNQQPQNRNPTGGTATVTTTATDATLLPTATTTQVATPAIGTVQNFFNSIGTAPLRRMEFFRNAFLGNGNSSRSNRYSSVDNGGGSIELDSMNKQGITTVTNASDCSGKNQNCRKSSKDYQILNESIASSDATGKKPTKSLRYYNDQLSLPSLLSLDKRTQQKQQKQCNEIDFKVTNSRSNNSKLSHPSNSSNSYKEVEDFSTTASPYHHQQEQQNQQQIQQQGKQQYYPNDIKQMSLPQPNGYIIGGPHTNQSDEPQNEGIPEQQKLLTKP